ncbi:MAG: ferrous iron transport protein B [Candidatus Methanoplasma sp.]|jgi:ferrous iron transport protein B|nr:ferrous iron transport protein B [Candidatus Methanoplasma sp.]
MVIRIALAGNPNSGKTTIFNKLTGSSQRVGNWPGVTVERKEGKLRGKDNAKIVDLPGIYSLSPYSPEEIISRDFLLNDQPDAVINIVDATNLERNLYLTTQILEIGIPTVIALNMMDVVKKENIQIDTEKLSEALGCKVIEITALKGEGVSELIDAVMSVVGTDADSKLRYSSKLEGYVSKMEEAMRGSVSAEAERWYALKLLERDERIGKALSADLLAKAESIVASMEDDLDNDADGIIAEERYAVIGKIVADSVDKGDRKKIETTSDRIDRIVTSRWLGLPIFAAVMFGIYFIAIETIGVWGTDWLNDYIGETVMPAAADWLGEAGVADWLSGLIVDGIIGGVGAVVGFLPQMLVLFLLLVILEECGYMARVAFVMDRVFRRFGLSGKSFIPVLVGMGCGVPGVMSSRSIEGETERKITAMTVTFIPCSAKLPIIALIAGALFGQSALVAVSMYFIGIACVLMSGIILKKWKSFVGTPSPFIMELPAYHMPVVFNVVKSTLDRGWAFVKKAGTFILLACALVWFLSTFDWGFNMVDAGESMLADIGNSIKWIFVPLGFGDDWEFTVATITGLLAKENVVGTFGVLFGAEEISEAGEEIWNVIGRMLTPIAGYAFLMFNMMCAPCFAAIGAIKRELGSWKDTGKAVLYQCSLSYVLALIFYQFAHVIKGYGVEPWIVLAIAAGAALVYLLTAKDPFKIFGRIRSNA